MRSGRATGQVDHLELVRAVALAANTAWRVEDAFTVAVETVGDYVGWPASLLWRPDERGHWGIGGSYAREQRWDVHAQLPADPPLGGVLDALITTGSSASIWTLDGDATLVSATARRLGLRTGLAFSVRAGGEPVAVIQGFSAEPRRPEPALVAALETVCLQLARIVERDRTESHRRHLLDSAADAFVAAAPDGRIVDWNRRAEELTGWPRDEALGRSVTETLVPERVRAEFVERFGGIASGSPAQAITEPIETLLLTRDGREVPVEMSTWATRERGRTVQLNAFLRDITARRRAQQALQRSRDELAEAQRLARLGSWSWHPDTDEVRWSSQAYDNFAMAPEEPLDGIDDVLARVVPEHRDELRRALERAPHADEPVVVEHRVEGLDGRWLRWQISAEGHGDGLRLWGTVLDVSAEHALREEMFRRVHEDALTGLPNRLAFHDLVQEALGRDPSAVAVAAIDLDRFGAVNEQLGMAGGDLVLRLVGQRLEGAGVAAVGRRGGDEFLVLLDGTSPAEVTDVAKALQRSLRAPFATDRGAPVRLDASLGVAFGAEGDADAVLRQADIALHMAKARGPGSLQVFELARHAETLDRLALISDLRAAVETGGLELHYQPVVRLSDGALQGVEALVRWDHPTRGPIPPFEFVPLAEEEGLIAALDRWVLEEACRQLAQWSSQRAGAPLTVAVNVSPTELAESGYVERIRTVLAAAGLAPSQLILEITESAVGSDEPAVITRLEDLRALGVRIAIDDFGTGYSSPARLRSFPVDALKIDRSFVSEITDPDVDPPILQTLFTLARQLGLEIIAEGVETPAQLAVVLRHGCAHVQGFLFSRPLPAAGLERLLDEPDWDVDEQTLERPDGTVSPMDTVAERLRDDPERGVAAALDAVVEAGAEGAFLTAVEGETERVLAVAGEWEGLDPGVERPWADSAAHTAFDEESGVVDDVADRCPASLPARIGARCYAGIPLISGGRTVLMLAAVTRGDGDALRAAVPSMRAVGLLLSDHLDELPY